MAKMQQKSKRPTADVVFHMLGGNFSVQTRDNQPHVEMLNFFRPSWFSNIGGNEC